jgi:hypothetical protein
MRHFSGCIWRVDKPCKEHKMAVNPVLFDRPKDLLGSLIHEAAYGLLFEWGIYGGCGKDRYYHREEFASVSRKLGLTCEFSNRRYGWSITAWSKAGVPDRYRGVLELLRKGLLWGLAGPGKSLR